MHAWRDVCAAVPKIPPVLLPEAVCRRAGKARQSQRDMWLSLLADLMLRPTENASALALAAIFSMFPWRRALLAMSLVHRAFTTATALGVPTVKPLPTSATLRAKPKYGCTPPSTAKTRNSLRATTPTFAAWLGATMASTSSTPTAETVPCSWMWLQSRSVLFFQVRVEIPDYRFPLDISCLHAVQKTFHIRSKSLVDYLRKILYHDFIYYLTELRDKDASAFFYDIVFSSTV